MDGSAREYAQAITKTGLTDQDAERQFYHVTEKCIPAGPWVTDEDVAYIVEQIKGCCKK